MSTTLLILLITALVLLFVQSRKTQKKEQELAQTRSAHEQQASATSARIAQLQQEVDQLSPYRIILNTEQHVRQISEMAEKEAYEIRLSAKEELKQAGIKARVIQTQAEGILQDAAKESRVLSIQQINEQKRLGERL
ncbi:hypothetical protein GCM10028803_61980 [Larkinella knui]|uniref:Uncharacterized protein n=1 Tax=Larkinella knui TaxID=2025310 RepID=A0A3P1C8N0_9BACT|nr:hypothetical protein [Larkinella knui]RRB09639.1 hypothetical protein EHT87_31140 [Larkinella knui]